MSAAVCCLASKGSLRSLSRLCARDARFGRIAAFTAFTMPLAWHKECSVHHGYPLPLGQEGAALIADFRACDGELPWVRSIHCSVAEAHGIRPRTCGFDVCLDVVPPNCDGRAGTRDNDKESRALVCCNTCLHASSRRVAGGPWAYVPIPTPNTAFFATQSLSCSTL